MRGRKPIIRVGQVWEPIARGVPFGRAPGDRNELPQDHPEWAGRLVVAGAAMRRGEKYPGSCLYRVEPYLVLRLLGADIIDGTPYVLHLMEAPIRRHYRCIYDPPRSARVPAPLRPRVTS